MTQPPLYKYLNIQGTRLTLSNRRFKHAKPSTFNDTEDLTIKSLFPEDYETSLLALESGFTDMLLRHLEDTPTCLNEEMRTKLTLILAALKANPDIVEIVKDAKRRMPSVFNLEHMKEVHCEFISKVNAFMQGYRILCVSSRRDSEQMWDVYAERHQGVCLRITPNVTKDSKFQKFLPVNYMEKRPALFQSAESFQEDALFGNQRARIDDAINRVIYSKTMKWKYENEYRLAIPVLGEKDWETMPFHADEISEIYIGADASKDWKNEVVALAESVNPSIVVFEMFRNENGNLLSRYFR